MFYRICSGVSSGSLLVIALYCIWSFANSISVTRELDRLRRSEELDVPSISSYEPPPPPSLLADPSVRWDADQIAKEQARRALNGSVQADPEEFRPRIQPVPAPPRKPDKPKEIFPGFQRK